MTTFASAADLATFLQRSAFAGDELYAANLLLYLASAAIRTYTGQTISLVEDETLTLDPPSGSRLFLPELPVTAVSSITVAGSLLVEGTHYHWYGDTGMVRFTGRWLGTVPQSVEVVYSHGYAADSPEMGVVRAACLEAAAGTLSSAPTVGVKSEQVGPDSITYDTVRASVAEVAGSRLDRFRPLVVA